MFTTKLTFGDLPNLGKAHQKLVLVEKIRDTANINTVMGYAIINAINEAITKY